MLHLRAKKLARQKFDAKHLETRNQCRIVGNLTSILMYSTAIQYSSLAVNKSLHGRIAAKYQQCCVRSSTQL